MLTFFDLKWRAKSILTPTEFALFLNNDPAYHAPTWHQYGLIGHLYAVIEAAKMLERESGVNAIAAAIYHDAGKIRKFSHAVKLAQQGKDPGLAYNGHEWQSYRLASQSPDLTPFDRAAVRLHHLAYFATPGAIVESLPGETEALQKWMVLCAADAVGKGWTAAQKTQRPLIAEKFAQVARMCGIQPCDRALLASCRALLCWDPPQLPLCF